MQNGHQKPRALALVGMTGSGKSLCAQHLEQRGYYKYRFGQIVVDEVKRRGMPLTPANERLVREDLRAQDGINAIAKRALPVLQQALNEHSTIIIDGLYGFGEYKLLKASLGETMVVVAVAAPRALRYDRLAKRPERPLTPEQAQERDYREIEYLEKGGPIAIADYTLLNDQNSQALLNQLDKLVDSLELVP